MGSWNAYIWPRLVNKNELRLISNWLTNGFVDPQTNLVNYPMKMAGVVIVSLPLLLMFILFRKYIMRGVSRSGIMG
jgi:multiple sugar transport system permease protein